MESQITNYQESHVNMDTECGRLPYGEWCEKECVRLKKGRKGTWFVKSRVNKRGNKELSIYRKGEHD